MRRKVFKHRHDLLKVSKDYFLFGYSFDRRGRYPFKNEAQREALWKELEAELLERCYDPDDPDDLHGIEANRLRPFECFNHYPVKKKIFNAAKFLGINKKTGGRLYDKHPALETDFEFLQRTGLLNDRDRLKASTPEFATEEMKCIGFREVLMGLEGVEDGSIVQEKN